MVEVQFHFEFQFVTKKKEKEGNLISKAMAMYNKLL